MTNQSLNLSAKRALVTGAGTRIGKEIALALGDLGCAVAVHYSSSKSGAEEVVSKIEKQGSFACLVKADLSNFSDVENLATETVSQLGGLDILINNASYWPSPKSWSADFGLLKETWENWDYTINVNTRAPFFLIQKLAPELMKSKSAVVINILDQSISKPFLDRASHSISKSALAAVTKLAATALAPDVRVNALELGAILPPEGISEVEKNKRIWGGVPSVVSAVLFVLTNSFLNGEIIGVKGSYHLTDFHPTGD